MRPNYFYLIALHSETDLGANHPANACMKHSFMMWNGLLFWLSPGNVLAIVYLVDHCGSENANDSLAALKNPSVGVDRYSTLFPSLL